MDLSKFETQVLEMLRSYRNSPPSVGSICKGQWKTILLNGIVELGGAAFFFFVGWIWLSLLIVGFYLGSLARDYQWTGQTVTAWPLYDKIICWDRVAELLNEDSSSTSHDEKDIFEV